MANRPSPAQVIANIHRAQQVGGEFLIADLELALTMLARAAVSDDAETTQRNVENGRHALHTVDGLFAKLEVDLGQHERILELRDALARRLASFSA